MHAQVALVGLPGVPAFSRRCPHDTEFQILAGFCLILEGRPSRGTSAQQTIADENFRRGANFSPIQKCEKIRGDSSLTVFSMVQARPIPIVGEACAAPGLRRRGPRRAFLKNAICPKNANFQVFRFGWGRGRPVAIGTGRTCPARVSRAGGMCALPPRSTSRRISFESILYACMQDF